MHYSAAGLISTFILFIVFLIVVVGVGLAFRQKLHELPVQLTLSLAGCAAFVCLVLFIVFLRIAYGTLASKGNDVDPSAPGLVNARNVDIPVAPGQHGYF